MSPVSETQTDHGDGVTTITREYQETVVRSVTRMPDGSELECDQAMVADAIGVIKNGIQKCFAVSKTTNQTGMSFHVNVVWRSGDAYVYGVRGKPTIAQFVELQVERDMVYGAGTMITNTIDEAISHIKESAVGPMFDN